MLLLAALAACGEQAAMDAGQADAAAPDTGVAAALDAGDAPVEGTVSGQVQKGPFILGSAIMVQELNNKFIGTGKSYQTQTIDDFGSFNLPVNTHSYVEVVSDGYYYNEVAGSVSPAPLLLRALADLNVGTNINTNVLTTLERARVPTLIAQGQKFEAARQQAEREILAIFHIPEEDAAAITRFSDLDISRTGDANAILLAVSATMQGALSVGELSELVSKIIQDIAPDGTLDDTTFLQQLASNAAGLDLAAVRANLKERYAHLGLAVEVPAFEGFVDSDGDGVINKYDYTLTSPSGDSDFTRPTFSWTASALAGARYRVQLASDEAFSMLLDDAPGLAMTTYQTSAVLKNDTSYYWRVSILGTKQKEVDWGGVQQFKVKLGGVQELDGPGDEANSDTAAAPVTAQSRPTFQWAANPTAKSYKLTLSTHEDLSDPVVDNVSVTTTSFELTTSLASGASQDYYWAVTPVDENGATGERSAIAHFVLDTVPPTGSVAINQGDDSTSDETVQLTLNSSDAHGVSEMQIAQSEDFSGVASHAYATTYRHTFSPFTENSTLKIYVRFKDPAGNWSAPISDEIMLKRTLKSGLIATNTTWNLAGSPYVVTGNCGVASGATLTLEAGVRVEIVDAASLDIKGALNAAGAADAEIVITKHGDASKRNDKPALMFRRANLSGSMFTYARLKDLNPGIEVTDDPESMVMKNLGPLQFSHAALESTTLNSSDTSLLKFRFESSSITNVFVQGVGGEFTLSDSTLTDTRIRARDYASFLLSAVQMTRGFLGSYHGTITFEDSTLTGVVNDDYGGAGEPCSLEFTHCTVTDPRLAFKGCNMNAQNTAFSWTSAGGKLAFMGGAISHSSFTGNVSGAGFERDTGTFQATTDEFTISDSVFTRNQVGIKVSSAKGPTKIEHCNLNGNQEYAVEVHATKAVNAPSNWWGTTDTQQIDQAIYDGVEDLDGVFVSYQPVLEAAYPTAGPLP